MHTASTGRPFWTSWLLRVVAPVFDSLATHRLRASMPVEGLPEHRDQRQQVTHLEALGRALAGTGPWLEAQGLDAKEQALRDRLKEKVLQAIANATDPASPDHIDFDVNYQNIVDTAFLAHGLHRCYHSVWSALDAGVQQRVLDCMRQTRARKPHFNNWLLFSAMTETFLKRAGADWDPMRVDYAVQQLEQWYLGDGVYGDGPHLCNDYYNSYVIQPMLIDIIEHTEHWTSFRDRVLSRACRFAIYQERMIAPDGSFPATGRSLAYRCGAFQHLAQMALREELPEGLSPAQVRCALAAVIQRTLGAPGTFDEQGWLRIGLAGHQPSLGERYISTGSLYLCSTVFLPLGLPPSSPFWTDPDADWTNRAIWSGLDHPADHALKP